MTELEETRSGLVWEERFTASSRPAQSQTKTAGSQKPIALEPGAAASPVTVRDVPLLVPFLLMSPWLRSVVTAGDRRARPRLYCAGKEGFG